MSGICLGEARIKRARILPLRAGPATPFALVAQHLWGTACDFDSDGNSESPSATDWTELTAILRPECRARIDVDPVESVGSGAHEPLVLRIHSSDESLARRAAEFLLARCGGTLTREKPMA